MISCQRFLVALGFLTRLGPARSVSQEQMAKNLPMFPLVGLVLGFVAILLPWFGLFSDHPMLQAWFIVGASLVLTRALHWDGWADLADALGSMRRGDDFWAVLKDSRIGVFGVIALIMGTSGQGLLFHAMCTDQALSAPVWCFMVGRLTIVGLCYEAQGMSRPGLAQVFVDYAHRSTLTTALVITVIIAPFLVSLPCLLLSLALSLGSVIFFSSLAKKVQGINGDFLGAACIAGELLSGVAWLWTS